MCPSLGEGYIKPCTSSVCPSVTCLRFSRGRKAVETFNLVETALYCTRETRRANVMFKGRGQWDENLKVFFSRLSSSKEDRFTSNHDRNESRLIQHISWNRFHQQKCFVFVIICNPGGPGHVSQGPPCPASSHVIYLFSREIWHPYIIHFECATAKSLNSFINKLNNWHFQEITFHIQAEPNRK